MRKAPLPDALSEKLKSLPTKPGCYIYRDEGGAVLYVGKAVNLRNRVRSYFQKGAKLGAKNERMVRKVRDLETIVVDSELEALVLECNLIKQHRPPYNVVMRDDKSYPYIVVTKEPFPRVLFTRNPRRGGGKVFGPYTSAYAVRDTLALLHKVFPLIPCGKSWTGKPVQKPCLYYHLGQCLGPCAGLTSEPEYDKVIGQVKRFLDGKESKVVDSLRKEMDAAAESLEFEKAATLRDRITAIEGILEKQKVFSNDGRDKDVIAVVKDERGAAIQMMYIRGGKLIGQRNFILDGAKESSPGEAVGEFVKQYYSDIPEVPREVLLPVEILERQIVERWLRQRKGAAVSVEVPQGGEGLKLVDLAAANAEQALRTFSLEMEQKEAWAEAAMEQIMESLELPTLPVRVECYDISNIQGKAPVGSMVVAENSVPNPKEYRRFKVKYQPESPDDFAMMNEVILRRLRAYVDSDPKFSVLPDLIVIDGGKGQLSAAIKAREKLGVQVPMVGLAKKQEILYTEAPSSSDVCADEEGVGGGDIPFPLSDGSGREREGVGDGGYGAQESDKSRNPADDRHPQPPLPSNKASKGDWAPESLTPTPPSSSGAQGIPSRRGRGTGNFREVVLPLDSPGLVMLRRLRDEAHRFAITYHRKVRDKRLHGSVLDEIPGIGPKKRRLLLRTFGSIEGIRRATVQEIASTPTLTLRQAETVAEFLRRE